MSSGRVSVAARLAKPRWTRYQRDMASAPPRADIRIGAASELSVGVDQIARFYRDNWARQICLGLPSFYRWQFCSSPDDPGVDHSCVALRAGGEILGVMGLNLRPFFLRGRRRHAAELTTWVVSAAARGHGIGSGIMRYLQSRFDVLLGTGITAAALPIYLKSGFSWIRHFPRYYRILDLAALGALARAEPLGMRLAGDWRVASCPPHAATAAAMEELADCTRDTAEYHLYSREEQYLGWRYSDHPTFAYAGYRVIRPGGGGPGVAIVVRFDAVAGVTIAHVVDCFGAEEDLPAAIGFIDALCRERGAAAIDFYSTNARIGGYFRTAGWFSAIDAPFLAFTHLFHPPEVRTPPTTSMSLWARDDHAALLDLGRLYVTKSDLDLDRPTVDYYRLHGLPIDPDTYD